MAEISALTVFAGLPVRRLADAIDWYGRVLGREPDARPAPAIADYYLTRDRVPEHGTLQLREDAARAGGGLVTINVEDIAAFAQSLERMGMTFATQDFPIDAVDVSSVTVGTFEDPDGNAVTVVQPHPRSA
ncbi:VOC family protein [Microbacterium sp. 1P10UB]|uniref:VOC family protein n=1 Tax=unclassified Microbacterium TaxID=2609290 RepID=UPI0039A144C1